jgi:hypothetical protein
MEQSPSWEADQFSQLTKKYLVFPHYLINGTIFRVVAVKVGVGWDGELLNIKRVLIFSKRLSETFLILRRNERDITRFIFLHVIRYSCQIIIKVVFFRQIFEKYSNTTSWKSLQSKPSCSMWTGREMDGRTDMTELTVGFRKFYEGVYKPQRTWFLIAENYLPQVISQRTLMWLQLFGCCYTSHLSLSCLRHDYYNNIRKAKNQRLGMLLRIRIARP